MTHFYSLKGPPLCLLNFGKHHFFRYPEGRWTMSRKSDLGFAKGKFPKQAEALGDIPKQCMHQTNWPRKMRKARMPFLESPNQFMLLIYVHRKYYIYTIWISYVSRIE